MRLMDKYEKEVQDAERKPKQEEREKNNEKTVLGELLRDSLVIANMH